MSSPNTTPGQGKSPARPVVSAEAVARLPRWPLWLLCAAYVLPGFVGRDPWKGDGLSFGVMWQIAQGQSSWLAPSLYGQPVGGGWLPYWLGAASIRGLGPWIGTIAASRLPFIILLGLVLVQTWYAAYHFAQREAAQPVQPAFAAAISRRNYARAMADGALLSLVACLGLLARGHETIPELVQLTGFTGGMLALSLLPTRAVLASVALFFGLLSLAASGAPWLALLTTLTVTLLMLKLGSRKENLEVLRNPLAATAQQAPEPGLKQWPILGFALACGATFALGVLVLLHGQSVAHWPSMAAFQHFLGTFAWFVWPAWPLAAWAVWRWRESLGEWHVLAPLALLVLATLAALLAPGNAATLVLVLPPAAALAALALPVMRRGSMAALDWFSLMFFSLLALVVWVLWLAMLTGFPAKPAANIARLAPGFIAHFSWLPALLALLATAGWAALVAWRAGRHRHPLWKGMVLSAGGVTLVWVLVGLLWLPVLNYASTYRPLGAQLASRLRAEHQPGLPAPCVQTLGLSLPQQALMGYFSRVALVPGLRGGRCPYVLIAPPAHNAPASDTRPMAANAQAEQQTLRRAERGVLVWSGHRPGEPDERLNLYRRSSAE
ncbi:conserved membrane hypothetical protein [Thiomonas sp. X19]|uniref:hypothetical protein n=1 Tax=Thiomonas sp. X19 TaxID=1050370 RepID=UPI000B70ED66|nr:hypothetical protein [Thiomonas sp. X19]SCC94136.1 conserved membrane hypothetical protein [Thiomonas sp. X19]